MSVKEVYIPMHLGAAGKWIYEGYFRAWRSLGYESIFYDQMDEVSPKSDYYIKALVSHVRSEDHVQKLKDSHRAFIYVQPNDFPAPWGTHPNFQCHCPLDIIEKLNLLENVHYWCFNNNSSLYTKWKKDINYIPLAFDHIGYNPIKNKELEYDVCYVGGLANNGFNEKEAIMDDYFGEIVESKYKIKGRFVDNQNVSLQFEADLLFNSTIALNIHDAYQQSLGFDVNERTFKSLGLTGFMISDHVYELRNLFPKVPTADNSKEYVKLINSYLGMAESNKEDLKQLKESNRQHILNNHTYVHRVNRLLGL